MNTGRIESCKLGEPIVKLALKNEDDAAWSAMSDDIILERIKIEDNYDKYYEDNKEIVKIKVENGSSIDADHEQFKATRTIEQFYIKNENPEVTSGLFLNSVKSEPNVNWDGSDMDTAKGFEMKAENHESGIGMYIEVKEELIIKHESNKNPDSISEMILSSMENNIIPSKQHPMKYNEAGRTSFKCYNCDYTSNSKHNLIIHLKVHTNKKYRHSSKLGLEFYTCIKCHLTFRSQTTLDGHIKSNGCTINAGFDEHIYEPPGLYKLNTCIYCNAAFKTKMSLDDHVVKKHPMFITSINRKLHECAICTYKTVKKSSFSYHMSIHLGDASSYKFSTCIQCNATFKSNKALDDHLLKKHPNSAESVVRKVYECTECNYKTVQKSYLNRHLSKHPRTASNHKFSLCIHCNAAFTNKTGLDDHIVKKHPNFLASISSKLHECTECTYRTVRKGNFVNHMLTHHETDSSFKLNTCIHCNATFRKKTSLDDHVIKNHPDFIASLNKKIYECSECTYKTVQKCFLDRHMSSHPETVFGYKLNTCDHCNATFQTKIRLDDHMVRKHPNLATLVARNIYECTECNFKTTQKYYLQRHLSMHNKIASSYKLNTCIHCEAAFKNTMLLDDHVIKKHPNFFASVTSKLHECTKCTYKTTIKSSFDKHTLIHLGNISNTKLSTCIHCNATFKGKASLDDHVIKNHPNFITSVNKKIHECTECNFKTVQKCFLDRHTSIHSETVPSYKHNPCVHCNAIFKSKTSLDEHVIRKHPNFITSVTSKLHECSQCSYKTVVKSSLEKHASMHYSECSKS